MHAEARGYVARVVTGETYDAAVEVGGRWINGGIRDLLDCRTYTSLDLHPGPGVDVVADVCEWTPPAPVDLVVCCEVLEHAPEAEAVVKSCLAMLAPNGRAIFTCAGPSRPPHSGVDGGPVQAGEHYANIEPDDLSAWLSELVDIEIEHHAARGDLYATGVVRP